jgi:hypothetical protein
MEQQQQQQQQPLSPSNLSQPGSYYYESMEDRVYPIGGDEVERRRQVLSPPNAVGPDDDGYQEQVHEEKELRRSASAGRHDDPGASAARQPLLSQLPHRPRDAHSSSAGPGAVELNRRGGAGSEQPQPPMPSLPSDPQQQPPAGHPHRRRPRPVPSYGSSLPATHGSEENIVRSPTLAEAPTVGASGSSSSLSRSDGAAGRRQQPGRFGGGNSGGGADGSTDRRFAEQQGRAVVAPNDESLGGGGNETGGGGARSHRQRSAADSRSATASYQSVGSSASASGSSSQQQHHHHHGMVAASASSPVLEIPEEIYQVRKSALQVLKPLTKTWVRRCYPRETSTSRAGFVTCARLILSFPIGLHSPPFRSSRTAFRMLRLAPRADRWS